MTYTADPDESHPQLALATLVNTAFGTDIDAEKLRRFMVDHWPIVRKLAHNIHRNDEAEKAYYASLSENIAASYRQSQEPKGAQSAGAAYNRMLHEDYPV